MSGQLLKKFDQEDRSVIASSGMDDTGKTRSASFLQEDNKIHFFHALEGGIDILPIENALDKFPQISDYYGSAFQELGRDFPSDTKGGYFIRVKKGTTVELPIQSCLFLKNLGFKQKVHNLVIIEEGARAHLITGCSASRAAAEAHHLGISEFFIHKGGYLNFTMIHSWHEDVAVKPMSVALLDEDASFVSNYICLKPVKEIVMYPTAVLRGKNSRASFNSLLLTHLGSFQDIGSRVILKAENTSAEIIARAVSLGGKAVSRGHLKAESKNVKAHLECRGLVINEEGIIHAVPELETDYRDVEMSHEAAIGKISKEEIEYLCSRGFSYEDAQSIIIRGFMDIEILALPEILKKEIKELEDKNLSGSF
ncbi:MAG TPA: SufD family Fe-S cluster assembly protein [Candidatus Omnitrophica bacterium]|nr:SufD family Fe-S cluster assembly protein [Candidatus Omnitrophota bacterium]